MRSSTSPRRGVRATHPSPIWPRASRSATATGSNPFAPRASRIKRRLASRSFNHEPTTEAPMEIGILKFDGTHTAEDALNEVSDGEGDRGRWLHEIGVVSRPIIGRLTIRASYPETKDAVYREGDIAKKVGAYGAYTGYLLGALAGPFRQAFYSLAAEEAA